LRRTAALTKVTCCPIGTVSSSLETLDAAPRQADEGAPDAWLVFEGDAAAGLRDIRPGDDLILITWLDRARRDVLTVEGSRVRVRSLEAIDGTPIVDLNPVLSADIGRR